MSEQFLMTVVRGDRFPDVITQVLDENDQIVNMTGASSITFSMGTSRNPALVLTNRPGSVLDGPLGKIQYQWSGTETDLEPGTYLARFRVVPLVGDPFDFPTITPLAIVIRARIGPP
jgi:hypothetical protein